LLGAQIDIAAGLTATRTLDATSLRARESMTADLTETALDREIGIVRQSFDVGAPALPAFDYLLAHPQAAAFRLAPRRRGKFLAVEIQLPNRRLNPFSAQSHAQHVNFYLRRQTLAVDPGL
jgi:uncharacterized protein (DUF1684 family)